jgi:hypothetical protein
VDKRITLLTLLQSTDCFRRATHSSISPTFLVPVMSRVTRVEAHRFLGIRQLLFRWPLKLADDLREHDIDESAIGVERDRPLTVGKGAFALAFYRGNPSAQRVGKCCRVIQSELASPAARSSAPGPLSHSTI